VHPQARGGVDLDDACTLVSYGDHEKQGGDVGQPQVDAGHVEAGDCGGPLAEVDDIGVGFGAGTGAVRSYAARVPVRSGSPPSTISIAARSRSSGAGESTGSSTGHSMITSKICIWSPVCAEVPGDLDYLRSL
jgi:hypothetical protein